MPGRGEEQVAIFSYPFVHRDPIREVRTSSSYRIEQTMGAVEQNDLIFAPMKTARFSSLLAAILLLAAGPELRSQSCDPAIKLFNGKDLEGWYTFLQHRGRDSDPKQVFTVSDGMIRISGEEWGCITTEREYENYRIVMEFKWGERTFEPRSDNARDCGLLLHSQGEDGGSQGIWMHSIECQMIEGGTGDFIVVGDGSDRFQVTCEVAEEKQGGSFIFKPGGHLETIREGRINWLKRDPEWQDRKGFRGEKDYEKPAGSWNILVCEAKGDEISVYLNGMMANHATRVSPSGGRIQIQSEGAEVFIRRVDLIPLPEVKDQRLPMGD